MALTRRSKFGLPPGDAIPSQQTIRLVPLTTGVQLGQGWPLMPAGSAQSMTNFIPLDGGLSPRSRLSSINTLRTLPQAIGLAEIQSATVNFTSYVWVSGHTKHGIINSLGSISLASFVSTNGLGIGSLASCYRWQYAPSYSGQINESMLIAAGDFYSKDTLLCLYTNGALGAARYSYCTGAPKAQAVCAFDDYIVAWNVTEGVDAPTRARWCVRGNPFDWTGAGSGFEDLLAMQGLGQAIVGLQDNRMVLFTDQETWYAVTAAYPAQFNFFPLDRSIGCASPNSVQVTEFGVVFLGSDNHLRLLPYGGGLSQVIVPHAARYLRRQQSKFNSGEVGFGLYDPHTKTYQLFLESSTGFAAPFSLVVNMVTGEFGFQEFATVPKCGVALASYDNLYTAGDGILFGIQSTGTVCSTSSALAKDFSTSVVTSVWESAPIAADLPGDLKQLVTARLDYRSGSTGTVLMTVSPDGGNVYNASKYTFALGVKPRVGRASVDLYEGGSYPALKLESVSTGYRLLRLDAAIEFEGRDS